MRRWDYMVGWICAVQMEYTAACELLYEKYTQNSKRAVSL